jgi:hypothetical protein
VRLEAVMERIVDWAVYLLIAGLVAFMVFSVLR